MELGCAASALEVRCPHSAHRADAAGYMDRPSRREVPGWLRSPPKASSPTTIIVECKAFRSDLLRDSEAAPELRRTRDALERQLRELDQECVMTGEPSLRRDAGYLFPELAPWELGASASPCRKILMRSLRRVDEQLHGGTKFFMLAKYHVGTHLVIAAEPGIVEASELPSAWGLIVRRRDGAGFDVMRPPPTLSPSQVAITRTLREIAAALSSGARGNAGKADDTGTITTA
jgi:hypothetical protein